MRYSYCVSIISCQLILKLVQKSYLRERRTGRKARAGIKVRRLLYDLNSESDLLKLSLELLKPSFQRNTIVFFPPAMAHLLPVELSIAILYGMLQLLIGVATLWQQWHYGRMSSRFARALR
jgi:hypothetical protein